MSATWAFVENYRGYDIHQIGTKRTRYPYRCQLPDWEHGPHARCSSLERARSLLDYSLDTHSLPSDGGSDEY